MTYLELVNAILRRVREQEVITVSQTNYSKLIGDFINETKREVEDAWNWNVLRQTISVTTVSGTSSYALTGAGQRAKILDAYNTTGQWFMANASKSYANEQLRVSTPAPVGAPYYYSTNGVDASGDIKVDIIPEPNVAHVLKFDCYVPQGDLTNDTDVLLVDQNAVIQGALMKAIIERGEDGGKGSDLQIDAYRKAVGNAIAIEANRDDDLITWEPV